MFSFLKRSTAAPPTPPDDNKISVKRSDGKAHDLSAFVGTAQKLAASASEPNQGRRSLSTSESTSPLAGGSAPIDLKRSDGVNHDIIKVYKSKSDSRGGDNWKLMEGLDFRASESGSSSQKTAKVTPPAPSASLSSRTAVPPSGITSERGGVDFNKYTPTKIRIIHMSDTYSFLSRSKTGGPSFLPQGDILIHSGNFTFSGNAEEFHQFNTWLGSVAGLYRYRIVIAGSRDVKELGSNWSELKSRLSNATHVLCHEMVEVLGLRIYGCPWHWGHKYNYATRVGAPEFSRFSEIPDVVDVLVSHGPAYGKLDTIYSGDGAKDEHVGSHELTAAIMHCLPTLHLHGHVNDSRGFVPVIAGSSYPMVVNSVMSDKDGRSMHSGPHVIEALQLQASPSDAAASSSSPDALVSLKIAAMVSWEFNIGSLV